MVNLWRCPECGAVVDYGACSPFDDRTMCEPTGKRVRMRRLTPAERQKRWRERNREQYNAYMREYRKRKKDG